MDFGTFNPIVYKQLFRPRQEVLLKVAAYERHFSPYTIGMHIRRTDHAFSIAHSPTALFLQAAEIELKQHPDMKLFPATDNEAVKREFIEMFGSHVLTSGVEADRNSREGLVDGLAELWTLSRT